MIKNNNNQVTIQSSAKESTPQRGSLWLHQDGGVFLLTRVGSQRHPREEHFWTMICLDTGEQYGANTDQSFLIRNNQLMGGFKILPDDTKVTITVRPE